MNWRILGLVGLLMLGLLPRLWIAFLPVVTSFRIGVPDDAYYYFTIARNLALGFGATSDRLAPTNGFHPLWLLAITPFWSFDPSPFQFQIQFALALSAFLSVSAALTLFVLARRLNLHYWHAIGAAGIFLFNPFGMASGADGLETSLALFLFGLSLLFEWNLIVRAQPAAIWATTGLIWGLLLVARTDYIFIVSGLGLQVLWNCRGELSRLKMELVALAIGAVFPIAPWVAWNFFTFGTILQISSEAYPFYYHTLWFAEHGADWVALVQRETQLLFDAILALSRWLGFGRWFVLVALGIGLCIRAMAKLRREEILKRLALPTLLAVFTSGYHVLYRWVYQPWYHAPLAFLTALWVALALEALWARKTKWVGTLAIGLLIAFYANAGWDLARSGGVYPGQIESLLRDFCGGYSVIGESDSGFSMYFARCTVFNLDGVVNNEWFNAIKTKHARDYLSRARIEHVVLNPTVGDFIRWQEGALGDTPPWR